MADTEVQHQGKASVPTTGSHGHPSVKEYVRIAVILVVITAAEVATYYIQEDLGVWLRPILFALSGVKFALVVLWYMHLKFDNKLYSRFFMMGLAGAVTLYLVVLMIFKVFLR